MLAQIRSAALVGVDAVPVSVEVSVQRGLPCFLVVGLPDTAVRESRDRVQAAFRQTDLEFPAARVTVNLAPADLRKEGTWFDLPIALGLLAASRQIPVDRLSEWTALGEISLDGGVRSVRGVLSVGLEGARQRWKGLIVPFANAKEAHIARDLEIVPVATLRQAMDWARGLWQPPAPDVDTCAGETDAPCASYSQIVGQPTAKRALTIAATGGHGLLLAGPPGTGKTLLARSLPELLPPLEREASFETTRIHSVAGLLGESGALVTRAPFRAPHVSASLSGMLGGGAPFRPGELTLAHNGVLFLDEVPEFSRNVLEALRQPMESHEIVLVRARGTLRLPARFQLVAAMNPCPCGWQLSPISSAIDGPTYSLSRAASQSHKYLLGASLPRHPDDAARVIYS